MNMYKVGRLIADRRTALGMTQSELARRLDVTDKAVSKWERGKSMPDVTLLTRLALELRISILELMTGEMRNTSSSHLPWEKSPLPAPTDYAQPITFAPGAEGEALVSPYLFGTNIEHTRSCICTGLSAQMLRNRKFVGKPSACRGCAAEWFPIGQTGIFTFDEPYTRHAAQYHMKRTHECNSLSIYNPADTKDNGLGQHSLDILANEKYTFAIVAKTGAPVDVTVAFTDHAGAAVYAQHTFTVAAGDWQRYEVELTPAVSDADADLRITFGCGSLCIGALSLLPENHFRGMRRDVIDLLKQLGIRVLRWPGGNFAGEYNWLDGLMDVDMRAPFESCLVLETQPHSMGYDFHEINTDDFIALCHQVGAEPFITINPCWNTPQESAAWVEYCNGDSSTPYGRLRAERGHAEPYNVQFWSLGNEFGYGHMEGDNSPSGYCRLAMENGTEMLNVSPNLCLCSSGPYPNAQWAQLSAKPLIAISQLISQHFYGHEPKYTAPDRIAEEYYACLASVEKMRSQIYESRESLADSIKISFDEWNVWYAWYRPSSVTDGIFAALTMHMLIQEAEKNGIALACHFEAINEGLLRVLPHSAHLTAQGQVFSLFSRHAGGKLVYAARDAVATQDADGILTLTLVNASLDDARTVALDGIADCVEATLLTADSVLPPSYFTAADVCSLAKTGKIELPPHSVALLRLTRA